MEVSVSLCSISLTKTISLGPLCVARVDGVAPSLLLLLADALLQRASKLFHHELVVAKATHALKKWVREARIGSFYVLINSYKLDSLWRICDMKWANDLDEHHPRKIWKYEINVKHPLQPPTWLLLWIHTFFASRLWWVIGSRASAIWLEPLYPLCALFRDSGSIKSTSSPYLLWFFICC